MNNTIISFALLFSVAFAQMYPYDNNQGYQNPGNANLNQGYSNYADNNGRYPTKYNNGYRWDSRDRSIEHNSMDFDSREYYERMRMNNGNNGNQRVYSNGQNYNSQMRNGRK